MHELAQAAPAALPLAAGLLVEAARASQQIPPTHALLVQHYQNMPALDLLEAIVSLETTAKQPDARTWYLRHLEHEPSLVAATRWLTQEPLEQPPLQPQVLRALEHASKPLTRYRCAACGFEARQHFWQCPGCQSWDSYPARRVEEL